MGSKCLPVKVKVKIQKIKTKTKDVWNDYSSSGCCKKGHNDTTWVRGLTGSPGFSGADSPASSPIHNLLGWSSIWKRLLLIIPFPFPELWINNLLSQVPSHLQHLAKIRNMQKTTEKVGMMQQDDRRIQDANTKVIFVRKFETLILRFKLKRAQQPLRDKA